MNRKELLAALPPLAFKKLDAWSRQEEAARLAGRAIYDEVNAARDNLNHFCGVRGKGARRPPDEDKILKEQNDKAGAALRDEVQRLQGLLDEADQRAAPLRELVGRCFSWVDAVVDSGGRIVDVAPPPPGRESLAVVRRKLAALDEQIEQIEGAPTPAGELLTLALASIDGMARAGEPRVSIGTRYGDPLGLDGKLRLVSLSPVRDGVGLSALVPSSVDFLAWALEDVLKDRAAKLIGNVSRPGAIDTKTRETKLRDLAEQKLALERVEEVLICVAETGGHVPRRPDADIRAVLGVADV